MGIRRLGRTIRFCALIYLATLLVVVVVDYSWPKEPPLTPADAIVCLGGGADETMLRYGSYARAVTCADLYLEGAAPQILFTGRTAAPLMANVALARGVPPVAIAVEAESRSTLQNALFTSEFIPQDRRIIVVTDAFHLPRSWAAFRIMGYGDIALVPSRLPRREPQSLPREALAIWFNAARVGIWWATPWLDPDTRAALLD